MIYIFLLLVLAFFVYGWFIEPRLLEQKREIVPVSSKKLDQPLRLLFISDLHIGRFNQLSVLLKHLQTLLDVHSIDPYDVLVIGGDFFDRESKYLHRLKQVGEVLNRFEIPIYAVLGNHDYKTFSNISILKKELHVQKITVLENEALSITVKKQSITLVGLKDLETDKVYAPRQDLSSYRIQAGKLDWYAELPKSEKSLTILLSHNPDGVYLPGNPRPDIVLSGHTHGGQILIIKLFSKILHAVMPRGSFSGESGRRVISGCTLLISRGISGSLIPFRFFCKPQILSVTLTPMELPQNLVIGLAGKPRSGKDTVASMIEVMLPGMTKVAFGNAIKDEFDAMHGTDTRHNEQEKIAHRDDLNEFGASKRAIDPLYWVKRTINTNPPLLITDIRQPQEVEAVRFAKGYLIRIETDHDTIADRMGEHSHLKHHHHHEHESHLDKYSEWDYVIQNNGTIKQLEDKVRLICEEIISKTV